MQLEAERVECACYDCSERELESQHSKAVSLRLATRHGVLSKLGTSGQLLLYLPDVTRALLRRLKHEASTFYLLN